MFCAQNTSFFSRYATELENLDDAKIIDELLLRLRKVYGNQSEENPSEGAVSKCLPIAMLLNFM